MAKKSKKPSQKGRAPFKRNVKKITKDLSNPVIQHQTDLEDMIKEVENEIKLEKGILNHNWVARTYNVSVEKAKQLVIEANKV